VYFASPRTCPQVLGRIQVRLALVADGAEWIGYDLLEHFEDGAEILDTTTVLRSACARPRAIWRGDLGGPGVDGGHADAPVPE
jgi:hypothetical protein